MIEAIDIDDFGMLAQSQDASLSLFEDGRIPR